MTESLKRPNIIVILADDLGWGDLSCYGATKIATPNLDRLAGDGTRFDGVHTAASVCTPSRYSLLTGRYCWRSPLKRGVLMGHAPALIEPSRSTIASVLKSNGYKTAAIGKWHLGLGWQQKDGRVWDAFDEKDPLEYQLGDPLSTDHKRDADYGGSVDYTKPFSGGPLELGFDRFFGIAGSLNMPPYAFLDQDRTLGIPSQDKQVFLPGQRLGMETDDWDEKKVDLEFTSQAVDFIADQGSSDDPFFLYFAPSAPHRPQVPPEFLAGASDAGPRGDSVVFVDWMTGQLMDAVDQIGQTDNTLVVFTSDNGAPTIFEDDGDTTIHRPNGPWRGQKGDIWDGGHREPFIARWPARIPAGRTSDCAFGLIDLLPTVVTLAGLEMPDGAAPDGVDASLLLVGTEDVRARTIVQHSMGGAFSIRDRHWKAIFTSGSGGGLSQSHGNEISTDTPAGQLYDLAADPYERHNVWSYNLHVVTSMHRKLAEIVGDPANDFRLDEAGFKTNMTASE